MKALTLTQGKSTRAQDGFTSPHQAVRMEDLSIRLMTLLPDQL